MSKRILTLTLAIILAALGILKAQEQARVAGKVADPSGRPVPGVNIVLEGIGTTTVTDTEGSFDIPAAPGQQLTFSFLGMRSQTVEIVDPGQFLEITMQEDVEELESTVVVGYGIQKKESVVGAIGTASVADLKTQGNISNLTDALTGAVPGVSVLSMSGMPGGDLQSGTKIYTPPQILIRGQTTWNNASPLILVDGVERHMNDIDINEIESISVLKDASATAVFGVKGGNGVILITTKRGRSGKPSFNIEAEMSFETPSKMIKAADTYQGIIARNHAIARTRRFIPSLWTDLYASDEEISYYRTGKYPYAYPDNDWEDIMLKDFSSSYRVNASASGGTDRVRYFTNVSFNSIGDIFDSQDIGQGYEPSYSYDRLNIRTNFDFDITETTKLKANLAGMHAVQSAPPGNALEFIFTSIYNLSGDTPVMMYEDGMYGAYNPGFKSPNPYYVLHNSGVEKRMRTMVNMDYTLTQQLSFLTEGLSVSGKVAYDNLFRNRGISVADDGLTTKTINPEFYLSGGYYDQETNTYMLDGEPANMDDWTSYDEPTAGPEGFGWIKTPNKYTAEGLSLDDVERTLYYELRMEYARSFAAHSVSALAMFSRNQFEIGSGWPQKREDWVGRVTYNYNQRYLLEMNGAYNGSERFGPRYRFEFFPSVAGGWVISNEKFFSDRFEWIDQLKLRYSYGLVGNDRVNTGGTWPYLTVWETNDPLIQERSDFGYPVSEYFYDRYVEGAPGNADLRWETARKQNLGLEFSALKNRVTITADFFRESRYDMLLGADARNTTVPPIFGQAPPAANIGEAKSKGVELEITLRNTHENSLSYWLTANWAKARSEVIYKESPELTPFYQKPEGYPLDQTRTGIATGFIESWDDLYVATGGPDASQNQTLLPYDLVMLDFNADGVFNGNTDAVPYGYPTYPQNNYGFSAGIDYKGIGLFIRFVGAYNTTRTIMGQLFFNNNSFVPTYILEDTRTPWYDNADPRYPALAMPDKTYTPLGHYVQFDGSFLRLQSAQLTYTFPAQLTRPLGINSLRIYINGRNLLLWTHMPNDGVGIDYTDKNYPTKKQFNLGVNVQF